jgi:hypothetical protein
VFVLRGQVVISPVFVGAEPRTCGTGKFAGISVLTEFDEPAVALMEALSGGQPQRAVLHPSILSPYRPATWRHHHRLDNATLPAAPVREHFARLRLIELLTGTAPATCPNRRRWPLASARDTRPWRFFG